MDSKIIVGNPSISPFLATLQGETSKSDSHKTFLTSCEFNEKHKIKKLKKNNKITVKKIK